MVASHGPFQTACDLRGTENFLMDMAIRPEFAYALLDKVTSAIQGLLRLALQAGGEYFDMLELPGDDYAGNTRPIISPAMFKKFIHPCLSRLVQTVKEFNPQIYVMLHSDGAISPLLPEIISLGIDVIHPLEPLPATDTAAVKSALQPNQLSGRHRYISCHAWLQGRSDCRCTALPEPARCRRWVILAPSNHLQADIPPENVITLFDTIHKLGKYPLQF